MQLIPLAVFRKARPTCSSLALGSGQVGGFFRALLFLALFSVRSRIAGKHPIVVMTALPDTAAAAAASADPDRAIQELSSKRIELSTKLTSLLDTSVLQKSY